MDEEIIIEQPTTAGSKLSPDEREEYFEKIKMTDAVKWDSQDVIEMILRPLGMGHYGAKFDDQNIAGRLLPAITEKELVELGITKVGDKRTLLQALDHLKQGQSLIDRTTIIHKFNTPPFFQRHEDVIDQQGYWEDAQGCAWAYHGTNKGAIHNFCCPCRVKHKRFQFTAAGLTISDLPSSCEKRCCSCWEVEEWEEDWDFRFLKDMNRSEEPQCCFFCRLKTMSLGFQNPAKADERATQISKNREPNWHPEPNTDRQWVVIKHPMLTKEWETHFRNIWDAVRLVASHGL